MEVNEFDQATTNHMYVQISYLQELIKRDLTDDEKDNIHEFFSALDEPTKTAFEEAVGPLV